MTEKELERILKALANRRRLAMVRFLKKEKRASVGVVASTIKLSLKSTSRHLAVLLNAGIVDREQQALTVFYYLAPDIPEIARRIIVS